MTTADDPSTDGRPAARELLSGISLLAALDESRQARLAADAEVVRVAARHELFRAGEPGDAMYAVVSGRLEVVGPSGTPIGVLGRGAAVGELALLTGQPRTATVRAVRDSELLRIGREPFDNLRHTDAAFSSALTTYLGHRLAGTVDAPPVPERRSVVSIVALSPGMPIAEAASHLQLTIGGWARVGRLEPDAPAGTRETDLGAALDRCERQHDVVLLAAAADDEPGWRDFCLRQADRVLLLVDPAGPLPDLSDERIRGRDLAFWSRVPPTATASAPWLDQLQPSARHWIDTGDRFRAHLERTARRMFGRSVGIVLSGGGARGLAHVGVIAALREAGITIDRYGGSSMGAFVAALFAGGRSPEEVTAVLRREVAQRRPFADYTVPRRGLITSYRGRRMFERVFGDDRLEELPHDCFVVTADLITAETLVHRRGPIRHIVGASMSLPGLVPPLPWGGRLFVDGGVVNNLPVDVMADTGEGPVIAVEVMRRWQEEWERRVAESRRAPDAATRRRWGRSATVPAPSLVETLACAIGLGSRVSLQEARARAWLTVTPDLPGMGLLEWRRLDEAVAAGSRATHEALATAGALPETGRATR